MQWPDWKRLTSAALGENVVRPATVVANLVLITLLAATAAELTWRAATPTPDVAATGTADATPAAVQAPAVAALAQQIAQLHLFGRAEAVATATRPETVPETKLNLVLRAVIAGDPATARAIISDPSGNENAYAIGAQLPGGAELKEIHASHIILYRGGRYETLRLPKEALDITAQIAEEVRTMQQPNAGLTRAGYRDALINNPEGFTDYVRVEQIEENGEFKGFRLLPGRDREFFEEFGLEVGDIVTAVNGVRIDNPMKGLDVLRSLTTADQVSLEVIRDGVPRSMVVSLN